MNEFTHIDRDGNPSMVDVSDKKQTKRVAIAQAKVQLTETIMNQLQENEIQTKKGPVFQTAILAGIMGAKKTSELIPLCHPLSLAKCGVTISISEKHEVTIECIAKIEGKTGVEMEALTGASIAALTIYDMCKAFSHEIIIKETRLIKKTGGKSDFEKS